nr:MAG TPA: tail collar domain [Caudoviricetes sp.]
MVTIKARFCRTALLLIVLQSVMVVCHAQADGDCGAILRGGIITENVTSSTARNDALTYDKACRLDWNSASDSQRAQAEVEAFGYGKGNGSYTSDSRREALNTRCKELYQSAQSDATSFSRVQTLHDAANNAFVACKKIESEFFKVTPAIAPGGHTVTVAMAYVGSANGGVAVYLPVATNFSCDVRGPGSTPQTVISEKASVRVVHNEAVTFICKRSSTTGVDPTDQSTYKYYPEATLTIATANTPFQITFPDERDPGLTVLAQRDVLARAQRTPPIGTIVAFAGVADATIAVKSKEWLPCDGSSLASSQYPELFAAIGTTWGGTSDNFNLPDMRGQYLRGAGKGSNGGDATTPVGRYQPMDVQSHTHAAAINGIEFFLGMALAPQELAGFAAGTQFSDGGKYAIKRVDHSSITVQNSAPGETRPITAVVSWLIRAR